MTDKERITTARDALLSYARHKRNIDAWTREEKELLARRAAFLSPSSPHLDGGHGGGGESSAVERAALYRARIDERLEELRLDMEAARVAMWRIENALRRLTIQRDARPCACISSRGCAGVTPPPPCARQKERYGGGRFLPWSSCRGCFSTLATRPQMGRPLQALPVDVPPVAALYCSYMLSCSHFIQYDASAGTCLDSFPHPGAFLFPVAVLYCPCIRITPMEHTRTPVVVRHLSEKG